MNSDFRDKLSNAATVVEITLGMVILIACIVSGIGMVAMTDMNKLFGDPAYLQARMSSACLIIIGIELIKMITSYTIDSVVDVMLLAIARQMIVEHTSPIENLIAVLSIGILFVIRKYLYISRLDRRRSKKEIEGQVRLVEIPGADCCACCGTHVERTGEIGMVKFTGMINYKGGVRISLLCGMRALEDYERKQEQIRQISVLLSAKQESLVEAVERMKQESAEKDGQMVGLYRQLFGLKCSAMAPGDSPLLVLEEGLSPVQLRQYANLLMEEGRGSVILALTPAKEGFHYVLASRTEDMRLLSKTLNGKLSGRGGGSPQMVQGSFAAGESMIRETFSACTDGETYESK